MITETEAFVAQLKDAYEKGENRHRLVYIPVEKLFPPGIIRKLTILNRRTFHKFY